MTRLATQPGLSHRPSGRCSACTSLALAATASSSRRTSWQRLELSGGQVPGDFTFASTSVRLEFKSDHAEATAPALAQHRRHPLPLSAPARTRSPLPACRLPPAAGIQPGPRAERPFSFRLQQSRKRRHGLGRGQGSTVRPSLVEASPPRAAWSRPSACQSSLPEQPCVVPAGVRSPVRFGHVSLEVGHTDFAPGAALKRSRQLRCHAS